MFCVIGLGNPGKQYVETRHNVGFRVTDALVGASVSWKSQGGSRIAKLSTSGRDVLLVQPQTFMNRSGEASRPVLDFFKIDMAELVVVYDELDLDPGVVRIRQGGSSGGHRGLDDLLRHLPNGQFFRIRVGIGHPRRRAPEDFESRQDVASYVLGAPRGKERDTLQDAERRAAQAVEVLMREGLAAAQQQFHVDP